MHVLIVDDEKEFLELMQKRLSRRSMEVTTAADGKTALDCVRSNIIGPDEARFKVVVMDVLMPGMDGLETLQQMKAIAPQLPVILLTGHAAMDVAVQGLDSGAYDYMLKPVAISELIMKMEDAIRSAG